SVPATVAMMPVTGSVALPDTGAASVGDAEDGRAAGATGEMTRTVTRLATSASRHARSFMRINLLGGIGLLGLVLATREFRVQNNKGVRPQCQALASRHGGGAPPY